MLALFLALLAVLVASGIPGERLSPVVTTLTAPPLPSDVKDRDAALDVTVRARGSGMPVPGARVQAFAIVLGRAYLGADAVTDANGFARVAPLPSGEHWVVADALGFARASSHLVLTAETRVLEMDLGVGHELEVTVKDERGAPFESAELEVTSRAAGSDRLPVGGRTGDDGVALVTRLAEAPWTVTAHAAGYEDVVQRGVREGDKLVFTMKRQGALVVKVVGWDDSFVPGARVQIAGATLWPARVAETDKTGGVRISGLAAGSYALRAVFGQDCSPIEYGVMLGRGEEKTVTLHLAPGHMVSVRVMDSDGQGAAGVGGARVSLVEAGLSPFPIEGHTAKDGRARLGPISPGPASLAARADGFVPRGSIKVPEPLPDEVVVALIRAGSLVGRVTDARGFPIDGATIEIIGTDFYGAPIADDPRRSSFREAHFEATISGGAELVRAGELGVVPGPVPPIPHAFGVNASASLSALPGGEHGAAEDPWVTRNDGTFTAAPASPGRIRALVRHPQYVEALSDVVSLKTGGEASVDVVMHRGGTLEGRVVDSGGRPVSGAHVAIAATHGTLERSTTAASDGTFAFAAVPDSVTVSVARDEDTTQPAARVLVAVPEGGRKTITITLPEARDALPAKVKDDRDFPIANAQITAHSLDPAVPFRGTTFSDANGEAELANAKGIALRVEVSAPSFAPTAVTLDASASSIDVALARAESASGEVRAARSGEAIAGADVVLYTELGARHATTTPAGTFSVDTLAPGAARLQVRAKGFAPKMREVNIPASRGDRPFAIPRIELASEGVVEGTVTDARGDPIQGARVAKDRVPVYLSVGGTPPGVAVTDAEGRFALGELPEGEVTLEAFAPDVGRLRVDGVKVVSGRTTIDLRIVLRADEAARSHEPGSSGSVAVTLGEASDSPGGKDVLLVAVATGSEAERAGLAPNDVLVDVDDVAVHTIEDARARLSGPIGEDVVVKIRRGEDVSSVRVAREQVRR